MSTFAPPQVQSVLGSEVRAFSDSFNMDSTIKYDLQGIINRTMYIYS